ncbi:hypothetical protein [Candidatus Nucleicultrix amoebiphila]|jgi:hypothetical protein|uniref:Uncharacterized protein n=1 Tax=Candidatus Nucleicultrix amoebiphila FS5 TaxID=1414854 RepID=A0A1W6N4X4_9PROT|nr:hypothetical protein [Candidatus Nucleicultrix amoebiphila]ARN84841.1 hypothetical protein GQ61_05555 [Candidatus Nucleicultrix amoebiphila FS5]
MNRIFKSLLLTASFSASFPVLAQAASHVDAAIATSLIGSPDGCVMVHTVEHQEAILDEIRKKKQKEEDRDKLRLINVNGNGDSAVGVLNVSGSSHVVSNTPQSTTSHTTSDVLNALAGILGVNSEEDANNYASDDFTEVSASDATLGSLKSKDANENLVFFNNIENLRKNSGTIKQVETRQVDASAKEQEAANKFSSSETLSRVVESFKNELNSLNTLEYMLGKIEAENRRGKIPGIDKIDYSDHYYSMKEVLRQKSLEAYKTYSENEAIRGAIPPAAVTKVLKAAQEEQEMDDLIWFFHHFNID